MQSLSLNKIVLLGLFALTVNVAKGAEAVVVPGAPHLLPEDTLAYVRIENVEEFRAGLAASPTGRMLADPRLKPIAGDLYVAAGELFDQFGQQLGISLDELLAIPKGQLAFGLLPTTTGGGDGVVSVTADESEADGPKDESPEAIRKRLEAKKSRRASVSFGGLIVVETGDDDAALQKLLASLEQKLTQSGFVTRRDTIGNTSLRRIIRTDNPSSAVEHFSRDGATVIGIGAGVAEAAIQRWNKESLERTLAKSTDFASVMGRCIGAEDTRPQITFFVNPYVIVERLVKGSGGSAALLWPVVENLGVGKIRGIGGSVFQGGELFDDISHVHVLLDSPRDGIFGVVRPSEGDTNPPDWVPDDVLRYLSVNWRVDKTFDGFEKIYDTFSGEGIFAERVVNRFQEKTGLDLRESLVTTTKDRGIMITWLQRPVTFNSAASLFAVQLKDPAQTTETIIKLRETIWKSVETETIGTTVVYKAPPRSRNPDRDRNRDQAQAPNTPPPVRRPEPCGAIVGDWFLFSDSRQLLEHAIRANSGSVPRLSSQPDYDLVAGELGAQLASDKPFLFSFSRDSEALRQVYELAKSPNIRQFVASRGENNPIVKRIAELIENNELPPFDEFKKYFAPTGSFGYDEPTGMHFGRYTLKAD